MTAATEEKKRILPPVTLGESFRLCDRIVARSLGQYRWMVGNLPRHSRRYLNAILALGVRSAGLCDIHLERETRVEMLEDLREDMRNNFMDEESTDQFPALLDTMRRFLIPQQYLHDIVTSADMCVRIDRFHDFDQWLQLGYRLGGGTLLSLIPVVGSAKPGFEPAAIACGQAIFLTHLLGDILHDPKRLAYFMPELDLTRFEVDLEKHDPNEPAESMMNLIRFQVDRIEKLFEHGGQVVSCLDLDGQRVVKSVVTVYWSLLMKIRSQPQAAILKPPGLSLRERTRYRLKHLLGLEGGVSVLPGNQAHP